MTKRGKKEKVGEKEQKERARTERRGYVSAVLSLVILLEIASLQLPAVRTAVRRDIIPFSIDEHSLLHLLPLLHLLLLSPLVLAIKSVCFIVFCVV